MRLLHIERLEFAEFRADKIPPYVIASHRWYEGSEVTFQDMQNKCKTDRDGYKKIQGFATYIRDHIQHVEWLWIDTCCIDKTNAAELSESINLMFKWYHNAEVCLAYLADVEAAEEGVRLENSEWFQRGWTLQELLAPRVVIFISKDWETIGNKGASQHGYSTTCVGPGLEKEITAITGIPERVLHDYDTSRSVSKNEKLKWIEGRSTTRSEDMSYALYGIYGVTPGANYGEGYEGARQRLLTAMNYEDNLAVQQAKNFREITSWLSPPDPWVNHQSARRRHEPQTGAWLLESRRYKAWKSGSIRHLWLSGKAGCGKTILCSTAIEDVKSHCEVAANDGYAIFYFSFSDNGKKRYEDLLRSLVVQVGWRKPGFEILEQEYKRTNRNVPGTDDLEKIVLSCIASYNTFFFLLDALDESPEENDIRQDILKSLTQLLQKASNLKVLATSRELPDIRASMVILEAETTQVATEAVNKDIQRYVARELSIDPRLSRLNRETKMLIEETLLTKAGGMFRWAYCQLQELKKLKVTRPSIITRALNTLPATLDETYERILLSINEYSRVDGLKLLRWVTYAKSPPSLSELMDVAVIDLTGDGSVDEEDRPRLDDTLEILSGLVIVESNRHNSRSAKFAKSNQHNQILQQVNTDTRVRLAHFSVKEYLESQRIRESAAWQFHLDSGREHRVITQSCLVYIAHYTESRDKLSSKQDLTTFPLLQYAAKSWFYHASLQETGDRASEVRFLCDLDILSTWLIVCQPDKPWHAPFRRYGYTSTGLYYASFLGLDEILNQLLVAGAHVNAQGGEYGNALQAASYNGNEKVVQILLAAGADVNAQGGNYGNALQAASYKDNEKVVQILLAAGADVNAQGGKYGNALQAASYKDNEKMVQMLLAAGADVNAQGGNHGNALQAASCKDNEKVVQILLAAGADVNAQGGNYGNALQAASSKYNEKVVQILLAAGADVNAQGAIHGNALQAASCKDNEKVVQMLLAAGADVNAQGGNYGNALQAASYNGNEKVVQILLAAGADVNAQGAIHGNALQAASYKDNEKVVQILLAAGADVNAQGGEYGNALWAALRFSHDKIVQMLRAAGASLKPSIIRQIAAT